MITPDLPPGLPPLPPALIPVDRPWRDYPIGTKAHAFNGGAWLKMERGWKWNGPDGNGSTFPTPGGDACGTCVELPLEAVREPAEVAAHYSHQGFSLPCTKAELYLPGDPPSSGETMSDRPTPLTFDPYPWNQNGPTHGGKRPNAGRKPASTPRKRVTVALSEQARADLANLKQQTGHSLSVILEGMLREKVASSGGKP